MDASTKTTGRVTPWNKDKLLGQKPPLKVKEIWAIRIRLQRGIIEPGNSHCSTLPSTANCAGVIWSRCASTIWPRQSYRQPRDCHAEENTAVSAIRDHRPNEGCDGRMDRRRRSKIRAIFVAEPPVSVAASFDSAVFADCWVVGQFDRLGRSGIRDAFDATYESYDDLSADQKSQSCSVAARAHETRKHS